MTDTEQKTPHVAKRALSLAVPIAGSRFLAMISSFIGMIMLAHLGPDTLAASNLIYSSQIAVVVLTMSILFSVSAMVGQAFGAGRDLEIGSLIQKSWLLSILITLPAAFILWHIGPILLFLGQEPKLVVIVVSFFHSYIWAILPTLWLTSAQQFAFGVLRQRLVVISNALNLIVLVVAGYALIYGKWGLPALGAAGLGYAITIQMWFSVLLFIGFFKWLPGFEKYGIFQWRFREDLYLLKKMFNIGWPISVQTGGELLSFFFISMMVGWIGTKALAAQQVVSQYLFIVLVPMFSISQANGILVGQAVGAKRFHEINSLALLCLGFGLSVLAIAACAFLLLPTQLSSLYIDIHDPNNLGIIHLIRWIFVVVVIGQIFDTTRNIMTGGLRGLYDTQVPMIISIICIWLIGIPLGYVLAFPLKLGIIGLNIGSGIGVAIGAVAIVSRWRWQRKHTHQTGNPSSQH
tara:strand:+ start:1697 stop:3082 length:1386 start_codon:yes stop_codon:yes gene_type:complete